ncbi:MAG: hypothetical protein HYS17_00010 [Micavibrio aeruginosavorus]|uniref:Uncharacterized protein n=1 Tax=Micavibrio aeruginosavorus TaxID=349221 RepID=A0A7T5UGF4_9BACT|nr:MAG: hypothetical protein HYS17_00010 [Micavibrio aeruginosavorus]
MPVSQRTRLLPFCRRPAGDKYELLFQDSREIEDPQGRGRLTLYRIRAVRAIRDVVRRGDLGGYVQSLDNLSHAGNCWVADRACILGNARIWGDAWVGGAATVCDQAWVFERAVVCGQAVVAGSARVFGQAQVYGRSYVGGHVLVAGQAVVSGQAHAMGCCWVGGQARLDHDAWLSGNQIITEAPSGCLWPSGCREIPGPRVLSERA